MWSIEMDVCDNQVWNVAHNESMLILKLYYIEIISMWSIEMDVCDNQALNVVHCKGMLILKL